MLICCFTDSHIEGNLKIGLDHTALLPYSTFVFYIVVVGSPIR